MNFVTQNKFIWKNLCQQGKRHSSDNSHKRLKVQQIERLPSLVQLSDTQFVLDGRNYKIDEEKFYGRANNDNPFPAAETNRASSIVPTPVTNTMSNLQDQVQNGKYSIATRKQGMGGNYGDADFQMYSQKASWHHSELLPMTSKKKKADPSSTQIDLAYLFASPLMLRTSSDKLYEGLPAIGFKEEFEEIINSFEGKNIKFKFRYQMATEQSLKECLNQNPIGLHFSGHGFQNKLTSFQNDRDAFKENQKRGDFLLFERKDGSSQNMYETDLKTILETHNVSRLKFVVVASCHSYECGEIFSKAGVQHVICVDKAKEILDKAAVMFSGTFYSYVFTSDMSICQAFKSAIQYVQNSFNSNEANKFKMIPAECKCCENNNNPIYRQREEGEPEYFGPKPKIFKIPSRVEPFLFRNRDMFDILRYLQMENIQVVQVYSMPGLGKSSLVRNVTNHVAERNFYKDGILYLNLSKVDTLREAVDLIIDHLTQPKTQVDAVELFRRQSQAFKGGLDEQISMLDRLLSKFKNKFLFVLDNVDFILHEGKQFVEMINRIMLEHLNVQMIFSSHYFIKGIGNFKFKKLNFLNQDQAFELFLQKYPDDLYTKLGDMKQISELNTFTSDLIMEQKLTKFENIELKLCISNHQHRACVKNYLIKHPLFQILGGHPLAISMIAPQLFDKTLKQLFESILNSSIFTVADGGFSENTLIQSLEFTLQQLLETDNKLADIFYLLGITHEGMNKDNLIKIFEYSQEETEAIKKRIKTLESMSLISFDQKNEKLKVSQFVDKYINQKIDNDSKIQLNTMIATFFNRLIQEMIVNNVDRDVKAFLEKYEKDIVFCLNYFFQDINENNPIIIQMPIVNSDNVDAGWLQSEIIVTNNFQFSMLQKPQDKSQQKRNFSRPMPEDEDMKNAEEEDGIQEENESSSCEDQYIEESDEEVKEEDESEEENILAINPRRREAENNKASSTNIKNLGTKYNNPYNVPQRNNWMKDDPEASIIHSSIQSWDQFSERTDLTLEQSEASLSSDLREVKLDQNEEDDKVEQDELIKYRQALDKLKTLKKEKICKNTFNQFMNSVAAPMTNRTSESFPDKLLDEKKPGKIIHHEVNEIEMLLLNYLRLLVLKTDISYHEFLKVMDKYRGKVCNLLVQSNMYMLDVFLLMKLDRIIEASTQLLALDQLFLKFSCKQGIAITMFFRAKTLQTAKNRDAFIKALEFANRALELFTKINDQFGIEQSKILIRDLQSSGNRETRGHSPLISRYSSIIQEEEKFYLNMLLTFITAIDQEKIKEQADEQSKAVNIQQIQETSTEAQISDQDLLEQFTFNVFGKKNLSDKNRSPATLIRVPMQRQSTVSRIGKPLTSLPFIVMQSHNALFGSKQKQ